MEMVSLGPKKDGNPNAEFFTAPETLQNFETVRLWLQKHFKKVRVFFVRCVLCPVR